MMRQQIVLKVYSNYANLGAGDYKWTKGCCGLRFKGEGDIRLTHAQSTGTWIPPVTTGQSVGWGDELSGYRNSTDTTA